MNEKLLCVYLCSVPADRVRDVYLYSVRFLCIYFTFIVILNVPSRAHVSKEKFHFYALYIDE